MSYPSRRPKISDWQTYHLMDPTIKENHGLGDWGDWDLQARSGRLEGLRRAVSIKVQVSADLSLYLGEMVG